MCMVDDSMLFSSVVGCVLNALLVTACLQLSLQPVHAWLLPVAGIGSLWVARALTAAVRTVEVGKSTPGRQAVAAVTAPAADVGLVLLQ